MGCLLLQPCLITLAHFTVYGSKSAVIDKRHESEHVMVRLGDLSSLRPSFHGIPGLDRYSKRWLWLTR
jgi:hypothetical protein